MNIRMLRWRKYQAGLAAVEMTLVLPLLLLTFIATAEIGRMLYQYNTLTKAQRDGIRLVAATLKYNQQLPSADNKTPGLNVCPSTGGSIASYPDLLTRATNLVVYGQESVGVAPVLDGLTPASVGFCRVAGTQEVQVQVQYSFTPMLFDSIPTFGLGDPVPINFPLNSAINMKVLAGG